MKYAVEMGSGAMTNIPNVIKTGSVLQKLTGGETLTETHREHGDCISLLSFFQSRKEG
jgi:hypothetical protein